jgi:hypothetical protein
MEQKDGSAMAVSWFRQKLITADGNNQTRLNRFRLILTGMQGRKYKIVAQLPMVQRPYRSELERPLLSLFVSTGYVPRLLCLPV